MYIETIMTKDVYTIPETQNLKEIQEIFQNHKFHHLLIVDENDKLIGIVSDRDAQRMASPYLGTKKESKKDIDNLNISASSFMSTNLITITGKTLIDTAAILLLEHDISCLPIVSNENKVEGIISWKDLLKYYVYIDSIHKTQAQKKSL